MARELKYSSQSTDLDALQRELGGSGSGPNGSLTTDESADDDEYEDDRWTGTSH